MKKISFVLSSFLLLVCAACGEEGLAPSPQEPPTPAPVIELDVESAIYTVRVGDTIVIAPTYSHVGDGAQFSWKEDEKEIATGPELEFPAMEAGRHYVTLWVTTPGGVAMKEMRIDVAALEPPVVSLAWAAGGLKVVRGSWLELTPVVTSLTEAAYCWKVDGAEVAATLSYLFPTDQTGSHEVTFSAANADGQAEVSFTVEVCTAEEVHFAWTFEQTVYNVSAGRTIRLRALDVENAADAVFTWVVDGETVQSGSSTEYLFPANQEGSHDVRVEMQSGSVMASESLTVHVAAPEGTYHRPPTAGSSALWNKVYEFTPAPGQFVNENYTATTAEEACAYAQSRMEQLAYVSLGGFGGYVVVGFDHSVENDGGYNLAVTGNAFDGSSEPGIVWVMQDENGDGLPNDTWYELRGSEYGKEETWQDYAVTYFRPSAPAMPVEWVDNRGQHGSIDYLGAFHQQDSYYPLWVQPDSYTLRGTRLQARNYDRSGNGTYWVNESFDWGYVDNFSSVDRLTDDDNYNAAPSDNHFKISDAVTFDGQPANLRYIDFVKVQTGVNAKSGWLGEASTEVFAVSDFNLLK